jgi:hypothetical protein
VTRPAKLAGGLFGRIHERQVGPMPDLSGLEAPALLRVEAHAVWQERFQSELRSVQIMTRFLTEVVGAGDPIDVHACAADLVADEIRHVALCFHVCRALGAPPALPEPMRLGEPPTYLAAPMAERALATALSMLVVNETLSIGFIADLRPRCRSSLGPVLDAILADEEQHGPFGWLYVENALGRFPAATLPDWRHLIERTLAPHLARAEEILARVAPERQALEAWPDDELAPLGLFSVERQALVLRRTVAVELRPRLEQMGLWGGKVSRPR